jgi:hypothetical protein
MKKSIPVAFEGVVEVIVPDSMAEPDANVLANVFALARILATTDNPDAPEDTVFEDYLEACSDTARATAEADWDSTKVEGVGGEWSTIALEPNVNGPLSDVGQRVYLAVHQHEYGSSIHPFVWKGDSEPDEETVVSELHIDFEPEKGEEVEIMPLDVDRRLPQIPTQRREAAPTQRRAMTSQEYADAAGCKCPNCGSENVETAGHPDFDCDWCAVPARRVWQRQARRNVGTICR